MKSIPLVRVCGENELNEPLPLQEPRRVRQGWKAAEHEWAQEQDHGAGLAPFLSAPLLVLAALLPLGCLFSLAFLSWSSGWI